MLLSIIVVSYNTSQLTQQTLKSIVDDYTTSPKLHKNLEVFVVDNNSTDDTVRQLHKLQDSYPFTLRIIENKTNPGFATANNQAIEISTGKYVLLLNSDTIVLPGALSSLVSTFEHTAEADTAQLTDRIGLIDHLGIIAPQLLNADQSEQAQGGSLPTLFSLFCHMSLLDDLPLIGKMLPSTQDTGLHHKKTLGIDSLLPMGWVGGTAMMIKREVIEEIGDLDSHIFMYGEDIEFCMRARAKHWDSALVPTAKIIHLQNKSGSSEQALRGELLSYLYIWSKHKPLWQLPLVRGILLYGILLRIILFALLGKSAKSKIYYKIFSAIRHDVA
ncbi:glycosyltransferase family 2 protein [Candidatus Woesebacteria bacterium]|nr:glycosyltransferase family 2 protein [Candidatus Woesebacteria bacterium]